jgi:hypothetical protein
MVLAGGATFAQTPDGGESAVKTFASRVAEKLGLTEEAVETAMKESRQEMQDERVTAKLDAMVGSGRITRDQADAYIEWYKARPQDLIGLPGFGKHWHGRRGFRRDNFRRGGIRFKGPGSPVHPGPSDTAREGS